MEIQQLSTLPHVMAQALPAPGFTSPSQALGSRKESKRLWSILAAKALATFTPSCLTLFLFRQGCVLRTRGQRRTQIGSPTKHKKKRRSFDSEALAFSTMYGGRVSCLISGASCLISPVPFGLGARSCQFWFVPRKLFGLNSFIQKHYLLCGPVGGSFSTAVRKLKAWKELFRKKHGNGRFVCAGCQDSGW